MKINLKLVFTFVSFIVLSTVCLQIYWNYKNFEINKKQLQDEIKFVYEDALKTYYDDEIKSNFITIIKLDSIADFRDLLNGINLDSIKSSKKIELNEKSLKIVKGKSAFEASQSQINKKFRTIGLSLPSENFNYTKLDSILQTELNYKKISLNYQIQHFQNDSLVYMKPISKMLYPEKVIPNKNLIKSDNSVQLHYFFPNNVLLNRISSELILSLIFALAVISCLFFLFYIISKQKRNDEIKNDFINNITHEFKTPITTISSALEGVSKFNPENDAQKTNRYISIANVQLEKLEVLVGKVLETATIKENKLILQKEITDINSIIISKIEIFCRNTEKIIVFGNFSDKTLLNIDVFHFENVISNLLDNAIKYGGNKIEITIETNEINTIISIIDNGTNIPKSEEKAVFDKFYRISKGNLHDVKGNGIGLYYAKNIIEKHDGTLTLERTKTHTIFKITLPNEC
ncbi:MAG: sensor histidine kinase [Aestuariibaculum sp.]